MPAHELATTIPPAAPPTLVGERDCSRRGRCRDRMPCAKERAGWDQPPASGWRQRDTPAKRTGQHHLLHGRRVAAPVLGRPCHPRRPWVGIDEQRRGWPWPDQGPWHSFPSSHTAGGVALARAVVRGWPGARWPAYAGAAAVGPVQVPRGAHYPSDVLAGVVVGIAAEAVVHRLVPALTATAKE